MQNGPLRAVFIRILAERGTASLNTKRYQDNTIFYFFTMSCVYFCAIHTNKQQPKTSWYGILNGTLKAASST